MRATRRPRSLSELSDESKLTSEDELSDWHLSPAPEPVASTSACLLPHFCISESQKSSRASLRSARLGRDRDQHSPETSLSPLSSIHLSPQPMHSPPRLNHLTADSNNLQMPPDWLGEDDGELSSVPESHQGFVNAHYVRLVSSTGTSLPNEHGGEASSIMPAAIQLPCSYLTHPSDQTSPSTDTALELPPNVASDFLREAGPDPALGVESLVPSEPADNSNLVPDSSSVIRPALDSAICLAHHPISDSGINPASHPNVNLDPIADPHLDLKLPRDQSHAPELMSPMTEASSNATRAPHTTLRRANTCPEAIQSTRASWPRAGQLSGPNSGLHAAPPYSDNALDTDAVETAVCLPYVIDSALNLPDTAQNSPTPRRSTSVVQRREGSGTVRLAPNHILRHVRAARTVHSTVRALIQAVKPLTTPTTAAEMDEADRVYCASHQLSFDRRDATRTPSRAELGRVSRFTETLRGNVEAVLRCDERSDSKRHVDFSDFSDYVSKPVALWQPLDSGETYQPEPLPFKLSHIVPPDYPSECERNSHVKQPLSLTKDYPWFAEYEPSELHILCPKPGTNDCALQFCLQRLTPHLRERGTFQL